MNQRSIAITLVLMAAALTGTITTSPLAYADESETNTDQETNQKNVGSGDSKNNNCAENVDPPPPGTSDSDCQVNNSLHTICLATLISCDTSPIKPNPLFGLEDLN